MLLSIIFTISWISRYQVVGSQRTNGAAKALDIRLRAEALTETSPSGPSLAVKKLCRLPSEAGVCSGNIKRYYYSAHSRHCVEFVYGGCNGNENNFDNITECEDTCQGVLPCPYVAWVPGCTLKQNGEDSDGCQTYEMTCEPDPSEKDKKTTSTTAESLTTTIGSTTALFAQSSTFNLSLSQILTVAPTLESAASLNESYAFFSTTNITDSSNNSSIIRG